MRRPTRPLFLHPPVFHPLHPNIAPLLASTDSRSLANRANMRRIYPPDLEGVRSVVYNRDHESRDATIGGSFGFVVGRTIGSTNTVCVVNRFSDRNIGRATQMRDWKERKMEKLLIIFFPSPCSIELGHRDWVSIWDFWNEIE